MCPVCGEPMLVLEMNQVQIDRCDRCGGTWLDRGELERIVGHGADRLTDAIGSAGDGRVTRRRCPRCSRKMREIQVDSGFGVLLDRCRVGHGLWCDRGELRRLVRGVEATDPSIEFLSELYRSEIESEQGGTEWSN